MTVSSTPSLPHFFVGNGSATNFVLPFPALEANDIVVKEFDSTTGLETTLVLNTDYTISPASGPYAANAATVVFAVAPPATKSYSADRESDLTQEEDIPLAGAFSSANVESALDKLTYIAQELNNSQERVFRLSDTVSTSVDLELRPTASNLLRWNSTATALENISTSDLGLQAALDAVIDYTSGNILLANGTQYVSTSLSAALSGTGAALLSASNTFTGATNTFNDIVADSVRPFTASDPVNPSDGTLWYNTTDDLFKAEVNGAVGLFKQLPSNYIFGVPPSVASASTVLVPSGLEAIDDTGAAVLKVASNITVNIASSGAAGLDTGSEASNTWYYLWLCGGASGVTAVLSASSSSPTQPTGYTTYKRRLPFAVRNDNSSNFLDHHCMWGWPYKPVYIYSDTSIGNSAVAGQTPILIGGAATTATLVSAAAYIPPLSEQVLVSVVSTSGGTGTSVVAKGGATSGRQLTAFSNSTRASYDVWLETNTSQQIQYLVAGATCDIQVVGFAIRENAV